MRGVLAAAGWLAVIAAQASDDVAFMSQMDTLASLRPIAAIKKDQYETTAVFNKRICIATSTAAKATSDGVATLVVFRSTLSGADYDADKEMLTYRVELSFPSLFLFDRIYENYIGVKLASDERRKPSRYGSNAFGVTKEIFSSESDEAMLLIPKRQLATTFMKFSMAMKPDVAKAVKDDLEFRIKATIASPCFVTGVNTSTATITSPFERRDTLLGIVAAGKPTWSLVRKSTGQVLKSGSI